MQTTADQPNFCSCPRTIATPTIDGTLHEEIWGHAPWTSDFVDIEGAKKPLPLFRTRAKMLWDDECLYIGAELEEPHVWGTLTEHDCVIYQDNDFEVFLDPEGEGQHYVELEVNPLNTTWDLMLTRPYRAGGKAISGWEFKGLRTAVHIDGTLNDPSDQDVKWTVEIAIPWASMTEITHRDCPPADGDQWRINFSRVQWQIDTSQGDYRKIPSTPEYNWVWSPQGAVDMHRPERWGIVQFSSQTHDLPAVRPLEEWENRMALIKVWEKQQAHFEKHRRYAATASALDSAVVGLTLQATDRQFEATIGSFRVDHELRMTRS